MGFYKEILDVIQENKLSAKERKELSDSDYGVPELRKYPLTDKQHVSSAITYFDKCDKKYQPELARNIIKKIKEYDMEPEVSKDNGFYPYYQDYLKQRESDKISEEAFMKFVNIINNA